MGTRRVKLTGLAYWARVFPGNRDLTGFEDALKEIGGQTTIDVDLDKDNMDLLQKSKSMKRGTPSPDNPGLTRVKFTRKWTENFGGGAPVVHKADASNWDYDMDGPIGNGSKVSVILSVYDTSRKSIVGTRLDKVTVLEHVEYNPDDSAEEVAPKPQASKPPVKNLPPQDDLNDDLPF